MRVFLSWSGGESRRAAEALKPWLVRLLPGVQVWMSEHDLEAGTPWGTALHEQLKQAEFGILCLTAENLTAPWILYEAGALAMSSRAGCVVPYLLGIGPERLPAPLAQFQSVRAGKEGTWKIVRGMSNARGGGPAESELRQAFEREWPALASQMGLSIQTEFHGDILVVTPTMTQVVDEAESTAMREKMKSLLRDGHRKVVVDLSAVHQLSSMAMSFIFPGLAAVKRQEAEVVLAGLTPSVQSLFEMTRMLDLIRHFPTLDEALAHFNRGDR